MRLLGAVINNRAAGSLPVVILSQAFPVSLCPVSPTVMLHMREAQIEFTVTLDDSLNVLIVYYRVNLCRINQFTVTSGRAFTSYSSFKSER